MKTGERACEERIEGESETLPLVQRANNDAQDIIASVSTGAEPIDASPTHGGRNFDMGDDVGDMDDFGIFDPHADNLRALAKGGRIEHKPYSNKDGSKRWYWVFRWEARYRDDCRYRPTEYIGKSVTNGWNSRRRWAEDGIRPPCPKHERAEHREWQAAREPVRSVESG